MEIKYVELLRTFENDVYAVVVHYADGTKKTVQNLIEG